MFTIDQNLYVKNPSNVNGLSYLPSFKDESENDVDWPRCFDVNPQGYPIEVSDANKEALDDILSNVNVKNVIEIGIARNDARSFTTQLLYAKKGIYCGIDLDDKTFLNDDLNRVYTIRANSHDQSTIRSYLNTIGLKKCSVLFIDGWHSVNTVINDWKYTDLLDDKGVVIFHDTNYHPGPNLVVPAIDRSKYRVVKYCDGGFDWGIAAAYKL
jgi:hypothetical protein